MKKPPQFWLYNAPDLKKMGENIRLARLSKGYSMDMLSEKACISRRLLSKMEKGVPTVSIGSLYSILLEMGLEKEITKLGYREFHQKFIEKGQPFRYLQSILQRRKIKNSLKS